MINHKSHSILSLNYAECSLSSATVIPSPTTQVSAAVTGVSRTADIMEIVSSSVGVAIFLIGCIIAIVQFKRQLDQNGDVGQALERFRDALINLVQARRP